MPPIMTREKMDQSLTFRTNKRDSRSPYEIDDIDSKFAKVRFTEYLLGLQQVLKNRKGKIHTRLAGGKRRHNKIHGQRPQQNATNGIEQNSVVATPTNQHIPAIDSLSQNDHHLHSKNGGVKKNHRLNGRKGMNRHRNRMHRKQMKGSEVAGLGLNEIQNFRRQRRRSTTTELPMTTATSTTTPSMLHS